MTENNPVTPRVKAIREKCRATKPRIDLSRYKLVTAFYRDNRRVEKQAVIHYIQQPRQDQLDQKRNTEQADFPKRDLRPEDALERRGKPPLLCQQT